MSTATSTLTGSSLQSSEKPKVTFPDGVKQVLGGLYTLYYRQGNNPHPMSKNFFTNHASLQDIVLQAKKHCETLGVRFVRVVPFLNDLRADERKHMNLEPEQD